MQLKITDFYLRNLSKRMTCPDFITDIIRQCKTNPSKIAVVDHNGRRSSTYGDLYDIALKTCGYLTQNDIQKGSFVVINLPNCMEYLAVELGIWLAGCIIVPASPLYPEARINYIKQHTESPLVIDDNILRDITSAEKVEMCEPASDIAALFYTSGSTGNPKGVIHTFDTLSLTDCFSEITDVVKNDCLGYGSPMSFIAWSICIPFLRAGASIRIIERDVMTDIRKLRNLFKNEEITITFLNPSVLKQLDLSGNKSLRLVITGSEKVINLKPESGYRLINVYGMTETTAPISYYEITEPSANTPIGKFYSRIQSMISEDGEICLRGPLSPGYYKDPERSTALWSNGWLHTGDIGRMLPDGNMEYVNRKDWMVKINGQRVETGEIIHSIKEMPGINDATAKGFTSSDGHQYIVAYFVTEDDSIDENAIKEFISRKLASYMIPSYFVKMTALPRNVNGKTDVKSLQSPTEKSISSRDNIIAPSTENEKILCKAFETSLGISPVSIDDNFFSLGGDSIRVMQLQGACPEFNLSSSMIYRLKTVRAICSELETANKPVEDMECNIAPLSQTQSGIFVECMNRRGEAVYNNPILYRFKDPVDTRKLSEACTIAVKAHPNVFASIKIDENGEAYQIKNPYDDFKVETESISDIEFDSIRSTLLQPFDILQDRLFRIRIFQTDSSVWMFTDFHHIIYDGTSNEILLEDIEKAYQGIKVEEETFTGFDLAAEEKRDRKSSLLDECKKWYLDTFSEIDQTSLPDPDRLNNNVSFAKFEIDTDISVHSFSKAAERLGITENILATGAFGYMLGACTHALSSAFATIYNGRKSLKTVRTMSMLVKTLPVLCKWDKNTLVGDYFKSIKEQISSSMAYDLFSFAEICANTAYDSRVLFSYQDELLERNSLCGSSCEMTSLLDSATGEPLTVELFKSKGSMVIRTEYRSNMYSEEYIRKFINCFSNILSSLILSEKDIRTSDIPLVSDGESETILSSSWGGELHFDRKTTFVGMFKKRVKENPDSIAVVDENGSMTYQELDKFSDMLASMLIKEGVCQEDFVTLLLPRLNLYPVSYVACFKAGAAYVPMDYEYPVDRLQYMMEDSQSKILLTTHEILDSKTAEGLEKIPHVIFVDDICSGSPVFESDSIDYCRPDGLAYMIYTSGTTGKPKGVMIEHHSLTNLVNWYANSFGIVAGSKVAEHASFSFDGSVPELMTPLCFGGELHILPASIRKDLSAIYRYFCENRIDGCLLTTQLGMTMLKMYDLKLKYLVVGGEKLKGPIKTSVKLYNAYGPTEFTVASSFYLVDPDNLPDNIPIGKAVPNTLSAIIDSCGRLLPAGIAGELVLIGEQLSRGYWHRPDITAERFTDCPFIKGKKMYHTGDLAKWDENGELLFLGRIDTQIKLRGFRIELGEIENTLSKFPDIKASVVAVKEISGLQHLCAYYTSDKELDKEAIRNHLAASLTDYMVPTAYVQMDTLPMTPNGKVDIRRLPIPEVKAEEIVPPEGETESKIFNIVSEYLGNSDFGVTTNLISMGMTSLGAITLSLQIERKTSLTIPSPKILESPTIRQWVQYLEGSQENSEEECITAYDKLESYPMTDNQTGVYIDWEQHISSTQYNVPMLFHFRETDSSIIVSAVKSFIEAHSYIKTHLKMIDGQVMQVRNDSLSADITTEVLENEPDRSFFQKLIKPFNLFEGPLFRFSVFTYKGDVWLLSDIHHIIFDGGSEAVFAREIVDACNGVKPVPESFSAFDYSLYYKQWKESDKFSKAEQYFASLLDGVVAGTIPSTDNADGNGSATIHASVSREAISRLCRKVGVTENAMFLSAVTEVLHRFSREQNIAILTVSNGRSLRALSRTCGMFVQTLPVVSHYAKRTVAESLKMMHSEIVETLSNDKFPYTKIVENSGLKAQILLAYQGDVMGNTLEVAGKEVTLTGLTLDTAKFPISINVTPQNGTTEMDFEFDKAMFSSKDVEHFAAAVKGLIENMAESDSDIFTSDIPCTSESESQELIKIGSGPEMTVPDGTIVNMVKKFVEEYPDDPAVADYAGTISYRELDKASDLLAGNLLSSGLRKEDFVSLMLPRSKEFVIAYMAVFKAGGAYVPMDYEYPIDRLQYMVDDSMSRFFITTHEIYTKKSKEGEIKVENTIFIDDIDFSKSETASSVNNSTKDGLAYMIYTSGTTGKPKGVMIEHKALMNMIHWDSKLEEIKRGTHVAEHASFSFDASIINLMVAIAFGGELFIIPEEYRKDPEQLYRYLTDNNIETTCASTQLGMMLLSSYKLPIRYIMMGGEKLTGKYDRSIKVVNGYGPTEFTVCSSYHVLDPDSESENIPIGKAVPNTISAVVDTNGRLLPNGVPGELVLIGPQIARGYWNKEEITSKKFVDCPFIPGEKMYHTGDLVRWSEDGELLFMGRIDTQVKLRGFRIELGEIESRITSFQDVTAAVAQVKEISGAQHLCAYFTASSKIDTSALKAHLSSSLTSYMVPDALTQLDKFPLTPNGKVDLKKLPIPELSTAVSSQVFEAPEGEIENQIVDAFRKVLGTKEPISRNTSFFQMGGTSLLVMKVIVILSEQGFEITYSDIFKYPTARALAAFIEGYRAGKSQFTYIKGSPIEEDKPNFDKGEDGFDYTTINSLLQKNTVSEVGSIGDLDINTIGDVLLLGSTGYLGIHILNSLITKTNGKVYCVIRAKKGVTCEGRLKSYLMYYFDNTFNDLMGKRLFVIEGDMTDEGIMDKIMQIKVDTVINCAANVKHFAAGDEIEKINLIGTEKLIEYCLKTGSRLIHTSTHSISGQNEDGEPHTMLESDLYFGQKLMTKYQTSKFAAERAILKACAENGLRAKIMRLGNLMPRFSDGEFQINIENNGFMSRMRAYYLIGCIASEHLHAALEFAPIDATADAILTLARTPDKFTVFHPFNNHTIYIDDVIAVMRKCGLEVRITDTAEFNERLNACLKDDHLNPYITTLLAYGSHNNYVVNPPSLDFTVNILNAMDWRWPITGTRYLSDAFEKMIALEYFEK